MENQEQKGPVEEIVELGTAKIKSKNGNFHCITIIGQIEGHVLLSPQTKTTKYEHIIPQLVGVEEDENIDGLLILLNTIGGDVEAGLAIAEMISTMRKPTVSLVLGGGHSIGVPLAVSAKHSFIAPSATMTIHPIRINGVVVGSAQTFQYFNKMQERIVSFVSDNSKISKEDFNSLMLKVGEMSNDVGSVLFGKEAVDWGIIDQLGGISDAIAKLYELVGKKEEE